MDFRPHNEQAGLTHQPAAFPIRATGERGVVKQQEQGGSTLPQTVGAAGNAGLTLALFHHMQTLVERAQTQISRYELRIAQLENMALTDDLTGLLNRRGFYETFQRELARANRGRSEGGLLVVIDLDNFKTINDTHGHLAGDAVLRLAARTLLDGIRAMDCAARLGGDEFVLLLSGACRQETAARAQTLGWQLNHLSLIWQGKEIPVNASLGLKEYKPGDTPEVIFNAADTTLYAAKQANRNKRSQAAAAIPA